MIKQRKSLRNALYGIVVASTLFVSGCKDRIPNKEMVNSNIRIYNGHASREVATDMDFDGKYDLLETSSVGSKKKLFFKKGYGPSRDPGIEFEFVDLDFFKNYDRELFNDMVKEYYRLEVKNE